LTDINQSRKFSKLRSEATGCVGMGVVAKLALAGAAAIDRLPAAGSLAAAKQFESSRLAMGKLINKTYEIERLPLAKHRRSCKRPW
jgi:hypothetical protein